MSPEVGRKVWRAFTAAVLLLSVSYNMLWMFSASWILELSCIGQMSVVHAEAIRSEKARDWRKAAHLYAYLIELSADGSKLSCQSEEATATDWLLPLAALGWGFRFSSLDEAQARIRAIDERSFRAAYRDAARHLGCEVDTVMAQ